jgi:hypothetical protein
MTKTVNEDIIQLLRARVRKTLSAVQRVQKYNYDVFISYRQAESRDIASVITQGLRRGRHPLTGKSLRVFLDSDTIDIAQNIGVVLPNAINSSACFVVLLTPTYSRSEYTSFEHMLIAGQDWGGLQQRIIPILIEPCDIPPRLQGIRYLDLTVVDEATRQQTGDILVKTYCMEFPQAVVATHVAKHLGAGNDGVKFTFSEETGDINPEQSSIVAGNGIRLSFSWDDLDAAMESAIRETAGRLLADGFIVTDRVTKGWRDRWSKKEGLSAESSVMVYLEKLTGDLSKCKDADLSHALTRYGYELPEDFDRTFINCLPTPSPSVDVLHELINREAWGELKFAICDLASFHAGIAIQWCAQVRRIDEIKEPSIRDDLDRSRPNDASKVRVWAESLLDEWLRTGS